MEKILKNIDYKLLNGSDLAYIGDSYYELYIRSYLLSKGITKPNDLHKRAIKYVSSESHNKIVNKLFDELSSEEVEIYKKGRNYNYHHKSKSSKLSEYLASSGFEALIGYLYLSNNNERLNYILEKSIEIIEKDN